jgi:CAAX protease family protein
LLSFVVLTYALSWGYWVPLVVTGHVVRLGSSVTQFPALLGPMLAAFALTAVTGGWAGVRELASRVLRWRVPLRWWLVAIGTPLLLVAVALVVMVIGPGLPDLSAFGRMAGLPEWGVLFVWAAFVLVNGLGEETGWRGYALPLLRRRRGLLTAGLLLVPIWAGWHLPLFFLLQNYRDLGPVGIPGFLIGLACGSVVLAWLYESAVGSVLIVAVWHGTYNLTAATEGGTRHGRGGREHRSHGRRGRHRMAPASAAPAWSGRRHTAANHPPGCGTATTRYPAARPQLIVDAGPSVPTRTRGRTTNRPPCPGQTEPRVLLGRGSASTRGSRVFIGQRR